MPILTHSLRCASLVTLIIDYFCAASVKLGPCNGLLDFLFVCGLVVLSLVMYVTGASHCKLVYLPPTDYAQIHQKDKHLVPYGSEWV